jgi:hypothetical protein
VEDHLYTGITLDSPWTDNSKIPPIFLIEQASQLIELFKLPSSRLSWKEWLEIFGNALSYIFQEEKEEMYVQNRNFRFSPK